MHKRTTPNRVMAEVGINVASIGKGSGNAPETQLETAMSVLPRVPNQRGRTDSSSERGTTAIVGCP